MTCNKFFFLSFFVFSYEALPFDPCLSGVDYDSEYRNPPVQKPAALVYTYIQWYCAYRIRWYNDMYGRGMILTLRRSGKRTFPSTAWLVTGQSSNV